MNLESLVPNPEACRPIAHLFPESVFVWCSNGGHHVLIRGAAVFCGAEPAHVAAPTISEMMRKSNLGWSIFQSPVGFFIESPSCKWDDDQRFDTPESAWAALIKWQLEQGLLK